MRKKIFAVVHGCLSVFLASTAQAATTNQSVDAELATMQAALDTGHPLPKDMLAKLQTLLETQPTNYRVHLLLGYEYDKLDMFDQAIEEYKAAAKYVPNSAAEVVSIIKSLTRLGQVEAAGEIVKEAGRRFPNDPDVNFWQGNFFATRSDLGRAETSYVMAIKQRGTATGLRTSLAKIRLDQKRFFDAYILASQDIALDKTYWPAYKLRGWAALSMGFYKRAIESLTVAYEHMPLQKDVAKSLAASAFGGDEYEKGLEPALVNLYMNANLESPSTSEKKLLMVIWRKVPRDRAIAILDKAEDKFKMRTNPGYCFAMGDVLDRLELPKLAIQRYEAGLRLKPQFARGYFRLGKDMELYEHKYATALEAYKIANNLDPEDKQVASHLLRLQERIIKRPTDLAWQLKDMVRGK